MSIARQHTGCRGCNPHHGNRVIQEDHLMKTLPTWAAVVALGAGVAATASFTPPAFGQATDLQFKAAREKEARERAEQKRENRGESREERRAERREREQ